MVTVTSAELRGTFAPLREKAMREPVSVTHEGRESLVVLSIEEFRRLKALDTRQVLAAWELPDDLAAALADVRPGPGSLAHAAEEED